MDLAHGLIIGNSGQGRVSTATRANYAAILMDADVEDATFELAGDDAYTLSDYAAALSDVGGRAVRYFDMPEAEYRDALQRVGLPARVVALLSESSAKTETGVMADDGRMLSRLIGRPTTPIRATISEALGRQP